MYVFLVIYTFGFFSMFLLIVPVIVPFFLSMNINMQQFLTLQAYFGIVVALLEVPSGYLSDLWGRKKVLIVGAFIKVIGFTYLYFSENLFDLYIYQTIVGTGLSLVSGADIAILYDNAPTKKITSSLKEYKTTIMANYNSSKLLGETLAAILGGAIAIYSFKWLVVSQILAVVALFISALFLYETPYEKMSTKNHKNNLSETINYIFKNKLVLIIFSNTTIWSLSTFCAIWIFQKQWQEDGIDLKYFGYIWASYTLTSAIFSKLVSFFLKVTGPITCLLIISLFPLFGYWGLSTNTYFTAALFGYLFAISRSFNYVFLKDALNWNLKPKFRATINSLLSLAFRLGFFILGPCIGFIVEKHGVSITYKSLLLFFSICFFLFMLPLVYALKTKKLSFED